MKDEVVSLNIPGSPNASEKEAKALVHNEGLQSIRKQLAKLRESMLDLSRKKDEYKQKYSRRQRRLSKVWLIGPLFYGSIKRERKSLLKPANFLTTTTFREFKSIIPTEYPQAKLFFGAMLEERKKINQKSLKVASDPKALTVLSTLVEHFEHSKNDFSPKPVGVTPTPILDVPAKVTAEKKSSCFSWFGRLFSSKTPGFQRLPSSENIVLDPPPNETETDRLLGASQSL